MTDRILELNSNNELVAKDPATGNVRPIEVSDLSASSRLNLDDGALLTLGSNDDFGLRYDATADSFVVADNTNGTDTVTVDRTTGDIDTAGDVSATNVSADTQMNSSSTRPNIFADDLNANSLTGVSTSIFQEADNSPLSANGSDIDFTFNNDFDLVKIFFAGTSESTSNPDTLALRVNNISSQSYSTASLDGTSTRNDTEMQIANDINSSGGEITIAFQRNLGRPIISVNSGTRAATNTDLTCEMEVSEPAIDSFQLFSLNNPSSATGLGVRVVGMQIP